MNASTSFETAEATLNEVGYSSEVAIFVPSCDAYSDLWRPFFTLLWKHWPDCPYKIYLGSNQVEYDDPRVETVKSDKGLVWADCCLDYLTQIPEPTILFWLEDFFLRSPVDTLRIITAYRDFLRLEASVFRLVKRPGPDHLLSGKYYGRLEPGAAYRISTQAAYWRKDFLMKMIREGESIWQFEINGSRRSDVEPEGFYGVKRDLLPYGHHVVMGGKWFPWEAWKFGQMNIGCDFSRREIMPLWVATKWLCRKSISVIGLGKLLKKLLRRPFGESGNKLRE